MSAATDFARSPRATPGPRDWILDVFGSFVRDFGGWIAVADLLNLLDALGVSEAAGRSALSRMKSQGELDSVSRRTDRGYALTEAAESWFADGTRRIFDAPASTRDVRWVLATFTVPENNRNERYQIRSRLRNLGFGQLVGGLMIAPADLSGETERALRRAGLDEHVEFWRAEHLGFRTVGELLAAAWDLPLIESAYRDYLNLTSTWDATQLFSTEEEAFVRFLVNVNAWRELPFLDPGLPIEYLPEGWPADEARNTFLRISSTLKPAASRYFVRTAKTVPS